jgi:hypothetical protein
MPVTFQSSPSGESKSGFLFLASGLIVTAVGFVGFSIFSIIKSIKKSYTNVDEKQDSEIT